MTTLAPVHLDGPSPESEISRDLARRGLMVSPLLVGVCAMVWGWSGAAGAGYGLVLVLVNFALSAALLTWSARISLGLMMGAVLFGYLARLALIMAAVLVVSDASWISRPALGAAIIATHLGLLIWEIRYVSASLAFPGLKPNRVPINRGIKDDARS